MACAPCLTRAGLLRCPAPLPLADRIATISDPATLAPVLTTGEAVMYHGPSGQSVEATVAEMDMAHW